MKEGKDCVGELIGGWGRRPCDEEIYPHHPVLGPGYEEVPFIVGLIVKWLPGDNKYEIHWTDGSLTFFTNLNPYRTYLQEYLKES